jgi:hypothetical protein
VGNTGIGGWSSFAFPNLPKPIGISRTVNIQPYARPSMVFDGNTARSSGFWWGNAGMSNKRCCRGAFITVFGWGSPLCAAHSRCRQQCV